MIHLESSVALLSAFVISLPAALQARENGVFSTPTENGRIVSVEFVNDNIVRVTNSLPGEQSPLSGASVLTSKPFSGNVTDTRRGPVFATSEGLVVSVSRSDGAVSISAGPDRAVSDNGIRSIAGGRRSLRLSTMGAGEFYGAGERGYTFNLAGDTLVMYNKQNYGYTADETRIRQMNITMPLFISSNGYAVVFDDHAAAEMVMGNPIEYITESKTPVSYYFINGAGSLEGVTRELSALTGRQELPPFWSLGYITSKYGYRTQKETLGVVDTLKSKGYPVDGIVLDLYWYGKEQDMGRLAWDRDQWPDHRKMLADLKRKGVNTVIISQPYVLRNGRGIDNYTDLSDRGMFVTDSVGNPHDVTIWVGEGGMFDVSNPDTRTWLAGRYRQLTDEGVGGWWGDLGEPEVHPETGFHANGMTTRQYHNKYGNDWSSIIYDMFKTDYPDRRLMTMMRGGTTGLQRYSVFPWSTDVSRSWGGLQPQINIMLNSGLSGLGYMSHDVGGFAIDPENPVDPELYVRWLQLGTFSPILRTHAQADAEPYKYPQYSSIIEPLIKDRYRWLPYNYTLAWENAAMGLPLVRPLNFHTPGSISPAGRQDEYLWGRDVLVAPVLTQGATERTVIFPEGTWLDMANPSRRFTQADTIVYPAPLQVLPMFVRAGAFIPMADYKMANTGDYRTDSYLVKYYPVEGTTSSYTMFEDDRTSTRSLADGEYTLITFKGRVSDNSDTISVNISAEGTYKGAPAKRTLTFEIENVGKPQSVKCGDKEIKWKYNQVSRSLTLAVKWDGKPLDIIIKE